MKEEKFGFYNNYIIQEL